jgi:hypothetical protein
MYDNEEITGSEENQYRLKEEIADNYYSVLNDLEDLIENNQIKIYRKISVSNSWTQKLENTERPLGIYWAWEKDAAEAHWGYDKGLKEVTLESSVSIDAIDWITTMQLNINPFYNEEKEIRVIAGTPLKLIAVYDDKDKSLLLTPQIKNKTFKA